MTTSLEPLGADRDHEAQKKRILQQSRALRHISRGTRDGMVQIARLCRARRRAHLVVEGHPTDQVYILATGRVRVERFLAVSGRPMHILHLGRGDFVGNIALANRVSPENAVVIEEATVLALSASDLRELAARDAGVYHVLGAAMLDRSRILEDRLEALLRRKVESRLAGFLLYALDRWGATVPEGVVVGTSFRHHEIASMIGTGREWVTMTLMKLRRRRIIGAVGRRIVVKSVEQLRALAAGQAAL